MRAYADLAATPLIGGLFGSPHNCGAEKTEIQTAASSIQAGEHQSFTYGLLRLLLYFTYISFHLKANPRREEFEGFADKDACHLRLLMLSSSHNVSITFIRHPIFVELVLCTSHLHRLLTRLNALLT